MSMLHEITFKNMIIQKGFKGEGVKIIGPQMFAKRNTDLVSLSAFCAPSPSL